MKIYYSVRLMLFTALAVVIGVYSHLLLNQLHYIVGSVMVLFGIEGILIPIARDPRKFFAEAQFYLGHVDIILGFVMIFTIREFDHTCIIWATWTLVREAFDLYEIAHKVYHKFPAVFSILLSIVEIVFSILLLLYATKSHALTHVYLLVAELLVNGLSPIAFEIHKKRRRSKVKNS